MGGTFVVTLVRGSAYAGLLQDQSLRCFGISLYAWCGALLRAWQSRGRDVFSISLVGHYCVQG